MDILNTLQALNACHGPSGDEAQVAAAIQKLAMPYADDCRIDTMGNLIVHRKGSGPKVLFAAHMDSIGFIITHIDEKGFLRFGKLGGLRPYSILHTPVHFKNGIRGLISLDQGVDEKSMTLNDLYIDIGARSGDEAQHMVQIGDTAVFDARAFAAGERLVSPYMDNRISCVVLLMAMERIEQSGNDLYFVFTVQEELGLRGAKTAAFGIDPDYGVAVDVTPSDDELGTKHSGSSHTGGGAAIKVMDSSIICHPKMVKQLSALAKAEGIKAQMDVIRAGGTDAGAIHTTRAGIYTGGISVPCRYVHSPVEMVDVRDVEACANLVTAFAKSNLT
ncbi:MAG: M42 family metallopeptidase [Pseudoflavonifractor sp.]